jgi:hypothetical protein
MQGMPHSLLLTTTNAELQIMVPAIDLVRPKIGTCPFTTGRGLGQALITRFLPSL